MRTVLVLAALVALAVAKNVPAELVLNVKTEDVDQQTVARQYKVLELFEAIYQLDHQAEYYKTGNEYDIKANVANYAEKEVVERFFKLYGKGFVPKYYTFTIFDEKMRAEAKALYDLFYYAKDFETFYKTACWARVHLNEGMFTYTFYIAVVQRADTKNLVLPPFYEIWPEYYANSQVFHEMYYSKMRGLPFEEYPEYGIVEEGNQYIFYSNYSDFYTYGHDEYRLSYLTEDIGWNTFYTYFHALLPFWEKGDNIGFGLFKERRGEIYFHFYQQLLARYYLERLTNDLGEIPTFSWYQPYHYGYRPFMTTKSYPFAQRTENFIMQTDKNLDDLRFIRNYEDIFLDYLEKGKFKAYHQDVDFYNSEAINFVGNFWQSNPDLYEKVGKTHYHRSYEMAARRVLGGAPLSYEFHEYEFLPTALDFYQTSLRDPAFYQIYKKIMTFIHLYKKYLKPYTPEKLQFHGVKVTGVEVSKLETFFDFHKFNATNAIYWTNTELTAVEKKSYMIAQPRLDHNQFSYKIVVKSEMEEQATIKIFMGPKYDSRGDVIKMEDNWMNFVELDWFSQKLTKGDNVIERSSEDFFFYKEDSLSIEQIYKLLAQSKLPTDMIHNYDNLPQRLMLPRGTSEGFPVQFFVVVYKSIELPKELEELRTFILDDLPFGYPFDRPVMEDFVQPNMYVKDAKVYHIGEEYPIYSKYTMHSNEVRKH